VALRAVEKTPKTPMGFPALAFSAAQPLTFLSSVLCPLSSVLCPLSSVLCLLSSGTVIASRRRSNPARRMNAERPLGLPRRCAPRNDEVGAARLAFDGFGDSRGRWQSSRSRADCHPPLRSVLWNRHCEPKAKQSSRAHEYRKAVWIAVGLAGRSVFLPCPVWFPARPYRSVLDALGEGRETVSVLVMASSARWSRRNSLMIRQ
jgi:hypothetical protein